MWNSAAVPVWIKKNLVQLSHLQLIAYNGRNATVHLNLAAI